MTPLAIVRLTTLGGVLGGLLLSSWLVPLLCWMGSGVDVWRLGMLLGGAAFAAHLHVWTTSRLRPLGRPDPADPERRRAAHDYPFRLARRCFAAAIAGGLGTTLVLWLQPGARPGALVAGLMTYLLLLLPVLGVYLGTRRVMSEAAAGPVGAGPVSGLRQSVGLRLAFAVQLPVVACAAGIVLVEQSGQGAYARDLETYYRERYDALLERVLRVVDDPIRQAEVVGRLTPPPGVAVYLDRRGLPAHHPRPTVDHQRPLELRLPPYGMLALVTVLSALLGSWLAFEVTRELGSVRRALADLRRGGGADLPDRPTGLVEVADLAAAFEGTVAGFQQRNEAMREAAEQRRVADEAKARFLAHLSHELKSPLNGILGFTEVLLGELDGPLTEAQKDQLMVVWRCGDSLLRYILGLLDLARLDAPEGGAASLRPGHTDTTAIGRAIEDQQRPDPLGQLLLSVGDGPPLPCYADATYSARALLLAAGVLFEGMDHGLVEIAFEAEGDRALARVHALHAEAEEHDRLHVLRAVERSGPVVSAGEPSGATGVAIALLHRVMAAQGGALAVKLEEWPVFELRFAVEPPPNPRATGGG